MRAVFQRKMRAFFDRRATPKDTHSFGLNNTYVFVAKQGVLFVVLLVITFVAGVNYGNNLVLALFFYLVSLWLINCYVAFMQLASVCVEFKHSELTQTGDVAWVTLAVSTKAKSARQLVLSFMDNTNTSLDDFANTHYKRHQSLVIPHITSTPIYVKLPIITKQRGNNPLPTLKISSHFPLGIVNAWGYARFLSSVWAYPAPTAFDMNAHRPIASNDENDGVAHYAGLNDFDRLDNYIQGENLARVSWGHAARGLGLLTKHFADSTGQEQVLDYQAMPSTHHEDKLSMLSYAVQSLENSPTPFALVLPSDNNQSPVFGMGKAFAEDCLLRLAKEP